MVLAYVSNGMSSDTMIRPIKQVNLALNSFVNIQRTSTG